MLQLAPKHFDALEKLAALDSKSPAGLDLNHFLAYLLSTKGRKRMSDAIRDHLHKKDSHCQVGITPWSLKEGFQKEYYVEITVKTKTVKEGHPETRVLVRGGEHKKESEAHADAFMEFASRFL